MLHCAWVHIYWSDWVLFFVHSTTVFQMVQFMCTCVCLHMNAEEAVFISLEKPPPQWHNSHLMSIWLGLCTVTVHHITCILHTHSVYSLWLYTYFTFLPVYLFCILTLHTHSVYSLRLYIYTLYMFTLYTYFVYSLWLYMHSTYSFSIHTILTLYTNTILARIVFSSFMITLYTYFVYSLSIPPYSSLPSTHHLHVIVIMLVTALYTLLLLLAQDSGHMFILCIV